MPRHLGGGDITFLDGHSKFLKSGALAAGTNWNANITAEQMQITDLSKYLWSLKKSGSDL